MFGIPNLNIEVIWPWFCVLYALAELYIIGRAFYMIYYVLKAPVPTSEERPFESVAMLPDFQALHEQVEDQGFIPLGLLNVTLKMLSTSGYEWLYTNPDSTIWIEGGQVSPDQPAMVHYHTMFEDNSEIITRFPQGDVISTSNFHAHFAAKDLDMAYRYHVHMVKKWRQIHGEPRLVMSVDDVKAYDTIYHTTHRQLDLRNLVWGPSAQAAVALITAILMLYNGSMLRKTDNDSSMISIVTLFLGLGLGVVTMHIPEWMQKLRFRKANALDNRKAKPKPRKMPTTNNFWGDDL